MLIITRRQGQAITLPLPDGRVIEVYLVRTMVDSCRLGIKADRDIPVVRTELIERDRKKQKPPSAG